MKLSNKKLIHENKYVKLVSDEGYLVYEVPDIVCVLPVLFNGDVILIDQYRIPIEKRLFELVTGGINIGEKPSEAAKREVKEETGFNVFEIEEVGTYFSAPGYITQKAHVYIAYLSEFVGSELESHEIDFGLTTSTFKVTDIDKILAEKYISHPYLRIALDHLKENWNRSFS